MQKKLMVIMSLALVSTSQLMVAQRKGLTIFARRLRVINDSPTLIHVRLVHEDGSQTTFKVDPNTERLYRWHRGVLNITKFYVRPESKSLFSSASEDEITIPASRQGQVFPAVRLIYRGLGDYDFSTSMFRKWRDWKKYHKAQAQKTVAPAIS